MIVVAVGHSLPCMRQRSRDVLLVYGMNGRCGIAQAQACRILLLKVQGIQLRFQGAYGLHMHGHSAL